MRLTGRIVGVILGLVAALYVSGCRTALEPYTPAGADTLWQPEPVPDLFDDAATVVTDIAIENHADAAMIVVRTSGAPPQVRAHQRYEPTHVALDIQAARLGMQQQPLTLQDPGGTVIKVAAVERIRNMQPQVTVKVHVHETVPLEVEQAEGVIRLALAHRRPDAGAAESPAPAPEADAEPVTPETAAEPPGLRSGGGIHNAGNSRAVGIVRGSRRTPGSRSVGVARSGRSTRRGRSGSASAAIGTRRAALCAQRGNHLPGRSGSRPSRRPCG